MRCQGRPSTSASSCAWVSASCCRPWARRTCPAFKAPSAQPYTDAVVHEHLHAVGPSVGEEIGVVRMASPKTLTTRPSAVSVPARMSNGSTDSHSASALITGAPRAPRSHSPLRHSPRRLKPRESPLCVQSRRESRRRATLPQSHSNVLEKSREAALHGAMTFAQVAAFRMNAMTASTRDLKSSTSKSGFSSHTARATATLSTFSKTFSDASLKGRT
jgi:hypothetical protein